MLNPQQYDPTLARVLVLDELFDLSLYKALRGIMTSDVQKMLDELIRIETGHLAFWQEFFDLRLTTLDLRRRLKLKLIIAICRLFGVPAVFLALEAIEVYGVRKYLALWRTYRDGPLAQALKNILEDEFKHEDLLITKLSERKINPQRVRNIFLGLNDGLVEILGAVSGFFAAFGDAGPVLIAGTTTAVAGSLSMAAGAYVALSSENEVKITEEDKKRFLGEGIGTDGENERPLSSSLVVGGSYFLGAIVPLLPVAFGVKNALGSLVTAGSLIILVSMIVAFLSGMNIKKRILTNLVIVAAAVGITYAIGVAAKSLWGISV